MAHGVEFYPPRLNPFLVRLVQSVTAILMRWLYWIDLEIDRTDLDRLIQLRQQRVLLLPNHPTFHDPIVIFALAARLRQPFYYLAAYETFHNPSTMFLISAGFAPLRWFAKFDGVKRLLQWFLQSLGMYSIRRGLADRLSIAQTLDLFSQSGCHLVIFPEGGCSFQNDTVMPFRVGGVQLAFQALNRMAKQGEALPDLYVIPVTIKYKYSQDMQPVIQATLDRLEAALNLAPSATTSQYERLRSIAEAVLIRIEQEYGLHNSANDEKNWNERIELIKTKVIQECEQRLSLNFAAGEMNRERVYRIQNILRNKADSLDRDPNLTPALAEKAMSRLLNFDAIYDGYVAEKPTPERFMDTLIRLEREVFNIDQPPPKGFRQAKLQLGEPINLKDQFAAYSNNRSTVVNQVVANVQETIQTNLDRFQP